MPEQIKVAILKSRLYRGGVAQVLGYVIKCLNEINIIPDILVLRSDIEQKDFENLYQINVRFRLKFIGPDLKMPYEWHFLYFNILSRPYAKKYDLFINSNNTSFLSPHKIKTITYTHFPRKNRVMSDCSSIHFPESEDKSVWDLKNDPFYIARLLYRFNRQFGKKERIIANSVFTAEQIKASYPSLLNFPEVIYPPIQNSENKKSEKKIQVVSLGRVSPEKRQLEQIEVAKHFPEINFYILGFTDYKGYYQECVSKIKTENLKNVHLRTNQNYSEINKVLSESMIFLHCVRNEPFGISTIQALGHGCIPLVHQSGGSKEIVIHKKFMFENTQDCIFKLRALIDEGQAANSPLLESIRLHDFSTNNFIEKFNSVLEANLK